ncbi:MAG: hypothetical protein H6653_10485 [Ardenticatenaceae bacterium]|nr:hypothetical protein [Ardenticatenaceae bacterium]
MLHTHQSPHLCASQFGTAWLQIEAYLCGLDLRYNDGTPNEGWSVFGEAMEQ